MLITSVQTLAVFHYRMQALWISTDLLVLFLFVLFFSVGFSVTVTALSNLVCPAQLSTLQLCRETAHMYHGAFSYKVVLLNISTVLCS